MNRSSTTLRSTFNNSKVIHNNTYNHLYKNVITPTQPSKPKPNRTAKPDRPPKLRSVRSHNASSFSQKKARSEKSSTSPRFSSISVPERPDHQERPSFRSFIIPERTPLIRPASSERQHPRAKDRSTPHPPWFHFCAKKKSKSKQRVCRSTKGLPSQFLLSQVTLRRSTPLTYNLPR